MFQTKLNLALALLVLIAVAGLGAGVLQSAATADPPAAKAETKPDHAQIPAVAVVPKGEIKDELPSAHSKVLRLYEKLAKPIALDKPIDRNTPLKDAVEFFSDRFDVTILVDIVAFKAEGVENVEELPVGLPRMAQASLSTILRLLTGQVNATYLVTASHIEITTARRTRPAEWTAEMRHLVPTVTVLFRNEKLDLALRELAGLTGVNVLVDARVAEMVSKTAISEEFCNTPVDTAVRLLTDMVDLKVVAVDNVLYVTTKANAETLRAEQQGLRTGRPSRPAPAVPNDKGGAGKTPEGRKSS